MKLKKLRLIYLIIFVVLIIITLIITKRYFAIAEVTTFSVEKEQPIIPLTSIVNLGQEDRYFVWIIKNNKAESIEIKLGEPTNDGRVKIVDGLRRKDEIILYSSKPLYEGLSVREKRLLAKLFGKDKYDYVGKKDFIGASGEKDIHIQVILKKDIPVSGYKIMTEDNQRWVYPYNSSDWIIYPVRKGNVVDLFFEPKTPFVYNLYAVMVEYEDGSTQFEIVK